MAVGISMSSMAQSGPTPSSDHSTGFVAQIGCGSGFAFPQTDLSFGLCDGYAKGGVAVEDGDADLDLCGLPVEVSCHQRLADQSYTMHPLPDRALRRNVPKGQRSGRSGRGIAETLLPAALATRGGHPDHLGIKPTSRTCRNVLSVDGSTAILAASSCHCQPTSSWSCTS